MPIVDNPSLIALGRKKLVSGSNGDVNLTMKTFDQKLKSSKNGDDAATGKVAESPWLPYRSALPCFMQCLKCCNFACCHRPRVKVGLAAAAVFGLLWLSWSLGTAVQLLNAINQLKFAVGIACLF
jgi:hypothetical protein